MKLLILGATGATGRLILEQALAAGHDVTALVRDPRSVTTSNPKLTLVTGRATLAADVEPAVLGQDAVIVALGPRAMSDPVCAEAADALVGAMKKHGVKRVVWLTACGVGDSKRDVVAASFVFGRIIMPLFLGKAYANHARAEETLRASDLEWTVVRPVELVDKQTGKTTTATLPGEKVPGLKISRQDVATFMLAEVTTRAHVGQMPTLSA